MRRRLPHLPVGFGHLACPPNPRQHVQFVARCSPYRAASISYPRAAKLGFSNINATIRVGNVGGLAHYSRMGFQTFLVEYGDPQAQGRVFNGVHKRFDLVSV